MAKQRIAVLFGGASKDHSVSLKSAYSVLCGLPKDQYEVIPIGITRAGRWLFFPGEYSAIPDGSWENDSDCCSAILSPDPIHSGIIKILGDGDMSLQRVDVIFSVLHGKYGECGRIQGLCKLAGIAYTGMESDAANACTDKMLTHLILDKAGLNTAKYYYIERASMNNIERELDNIEQLLPYPLFVKAASCSSSIGANYVDNREELLAAIKIAFSHHHKAIVEEAIYGRDIAVAVTGNTYGLEVTPLGEIIPNDSIVDSNAKYISKTSEFVCPADVESETADQIKAMALKAYQALGCKGYAVVHFTLGDKIYCTKVCNIPGMTEENIFPRLMKAADYSYGELLERLINLAIEARA